jgi:hypothetical protein
MAACTQFWISAITKSGRNAFRQALQVEDDTWRRARGYALHQALMIIPYYFETNPGFSRMATRIVEEILRDLEED